MPQPLIPNATLGIITGVTIYGSAWTCMGRILGNLGTIITQASLSSITYTVRDMTLATTTTAAGVTISTSVFDSLQQNNPRWSKDNANHLGYDGRHGYNFLFVVPASRFTVFDVGAAAIPSALEPRVIPHLFQVDFRFVPQSGEPFVQPYQSRPLVTYS